VIAELEGWRSQLADDGTYTVSILRRGHDVVRITGLDRDEAVSRGRDVRAEAALAAD
jgi:hypothetical protein